MTATVRSRVPRFDSTNSPALFSHPVARARVPREMDDGAGEALRTVDHPCRPGRLRRSGELREVAGTGTGKRGNAERGPLEATVLRRTG